MKSLTLALYAITSLLLACTSGGSDTSPETGGDCGLINAVQGFASTQGGTSGGANTGAGNNQVVATSGAQIAAALVDGNFKTLPLTIYVDGLINWENSGARPIKIHRNNVSIIGRNNAEFEGVGIELGKGASNIIIRNLKMHKYPQSRGAGDLISLDGRKGAIRNIWIDHNELYNSLTTPGCDTNVCHKDFYDELISGRGDVSGVTVSFNFLHDSWKTSLWGSSDNDNHDRKITFHGNYWHNVNSRLPLFRFGQLHVMNNYYHNVTGTGINLRMGARARIDGNVFERVRDPIISVDSAEVGSWTLHDNQFINPRNPRPFNCGGTDGTCLGAEWRSTAVPDYAPSYDYSEILLPSDKVKAYILAVAGINKIDHCLDFAE